MIQAVQVRPVHQVVVHHRAVRPRPVAQALQVRVRRVVRVPLARRVHQALQVPRRRAVRVPPARRAVRPRHRVVVVENGHMKNVVKTLTLTVALVHIVMGNVVMIGMMCMAVAEVMILVAEILILVAEILILVVEVMILVVVCLDVQIVMESVILVTVKPVNVHMVINVL